MDTVTCSKCGKALNEKDIYCRKCKTLNLNMPVKENTYKELGVRADKTLSKAKALRIAWVITLVIALLGIMLTLGGRIPLKKSVEYQLELEPYTGTLAEGEKCEINISFAIELATVVSAEKMEYGSEYIYLPGNETVYFLVTDDDQDVAIVGTSNDDTTEYLRSLSEGKGKAKAFAACAVAPPDNISADTNAVSAYEYILDKYLPEGYASEITDNTQVSKENVDIFNGIVAEHTNLTIDNVRTTAYERVNNIYGIVTLCAAGALAVVGVIILIMEKRCVRYSNLILQLRNSLLIAHTQAEGEGNEESNENLIYRNYN